MASGPFLRDFRGGAKRQEVFMSALVTGGTGFIGAQVVRVLLERGEKELVVFHVNPAKKTLDDVSGQVDLVRGDLGNFSHVLDVVKNFRPRVIYHLGAVLTLPGEMDPSAVFQANARGIFHVLEAARLFEVEQVIFTSSIGSYGLDIGGDVIDDYTLQRPTTIYGITKVFGEHLGLFYKRKYGVDFRCVRYPGIVGPGFRTSSPVQYMSLLIEESVKGNPYAAYVKPEAKFPMMYFKDAALSVVKLGEAPLENIKMVNYIIDGVTPTPTAQELANIVKARIPNARITYEPNPLYEQVFERTPSVDDGIARKEWGWNPEYNLEQTVDDFVEELRRHPQRYR
jgi:threonine 3-dehydrogenase